jgi:hypothetical protein
MLQSGFKDLQHDSTVWLKLEVLVVGLELEKKSA